MGAGASAAGMPIEERRELYSELRNKYTRSDLDNLAEEEKQAWLEVVEERKEAEAVEEVTTAEAAVVAEAVAKGAADVQQMGLEDEGDNAAAAAAAATAGATGATGGTLATATPEVTVRTAAEAAAARTGGATSGRKSGWDLSGKDDTGVRPQARKTRLSYLLAPEENDDGSGIGGGSGGGCPGAGAGEQEAADAGVGGRRYTHCSRRSSAELPGWKKTAEEVETPNELCVGDVVRARDKEWNGMWFEGVLTAIQDENTFEVEISGDDNDKEGEGGPQRITIGIDDIVRVMPWFCIEVGDMVECQPEGTMGWIRGTVVDIDLSQALYDVALESDIDDDFVDKQVVDEGNGDGGEETHPSGASKHEHSLTRVPDSRIRKIVSGRQAAAKRWKKVHLASCLTGLGRWASSKAGRLVQETPPSS